MSMSAEPDYYDLLQVPFDAGSKEIIATYRRLARQYHPDLAKDAAATKRMLALNRAIEILGDPRNAANMTRAGCRREHAKRLRENLPKSQSDLNTS